MLKSFWQNRQGQYPTSATLFRSEHFKKRGCFMPSRSRFRRSIIRTARVRTAGQFTYCLSDVTQTCLLGLPLPHKIITDHSTGCKTFSMLANVILCEISVLKRLFVFHHISKQWFAISVCLVVYSRVAFLQSIDTLIRRNAANIFVAGY